jgi:hypothetical protein
MSSADTVRLEVLTPAGGIQRADKKTLAPRPASLKGKKLGLIYNLKSGGDVLLTRTAELLKERYDIGEVKWFKRACCVEPPEGYIESAAEWSDVAVAAASD